MAPVLAGFRGPMWAQWTVSKIIYKMSNMPRERRPLKIESTDVAGCRLVPMLEPESLYGMVRRWRAAPRRAARLRKARIDPLPKVRHSLRQPHLWHDTRTEFPGTLLEQPEAVNFLKIASGGWSRC